ncbi:MAG: hypothetical protein L6Q46_02190 [Flavobacterium sp.]|uniref:hypothetical protein n=1 Tax=Flavobacterium sp. TaxID=239 RepID=UPI0025C2CF65|nr:hypothetical protein [Flavobacterium sp.]MCK6607097.1 hypothetical protein [Flavobacterium sp.]
MIKKYSIYAFIISISLFIYACSDDNEDEYTPVSPVTVDLTQVPYPKLSDYKFFEGEIKNQVPSLDVIPYEPASILFSDYAHKKRFIWMPKNTHGTYQGDGNIINLPVGAVLIKTFYYDNVLPANTRKIIETRIMIRKSSGWIFAEYVWNDEQTEAYLDMAGSYQNINWIDENNVTRTVNYRVPSEVQCIVCHKEKETIDGQEVTVFTPIGIKPQNLNFNYNYGSTSRNQLTHWIQNGYLENIALPSEANTVVDYNDSSKPIRERVRSYFDINCAHCHKEKGHCDYRPLRLAFNDTGTSDGLTNMGVCVPTQDMQDFDPELDKLITPRRTDKSMLFHRVNTTNEASRMPLHGRTLIHTEGVAIIEEWINSLDECR